MDTTHTYQGISYVLTNEGIVNGDKVFPISEGTVKSDGTYEHNSFDYRGFMSGFPYEPHVMIDVKHSDYKPYQSRTSHGFGPIEKYFKIKSKEPINKPEEGSIQPKEITRDSETGANVASFSYYDGIAYAKDRGLLQTTEFSDVRQGTHFMVCCGDVMVAVDESDFSTMERRVI